MIDTLEMIKDYLCNDVKETIEDFIDEVIADKEQLENSLEELREEIILAIFEGKEKASANCSKEVYEVLKDYAPYSYYDEKEKVGTIIVYLREDNTTRCQLRDLFSFIRF